LSSIDLYRAWFGARRLKIERSLPDERDAHRSTDVVALGLEPSTTQKGDPRGVHFAPPARWDAALAAELLARALGVRHPEFVARALPRLTGEVYPGEGDEEADRRMRRVGPNHYLLPGYEAVSRATNRVVAVEVPGEGFLPVGEVVIDPATGRVRRRSRQGHPAGVPRP
jgi:hypothetical protein